jgi:diadenosine tetraphosphatase ApaH/serine/threonine PP2A family protein phosphatase
MMFGAVKRTVAPPTESAASVPRGVRLYVIGDVHGRLDLLDALAAKIGDDLGRGPNFELSATVFLGDYIDRGPHSAWVIERLANGDFPTPFIALRGNHEAELLHFLQEPNVLEDWRHYGGLETLASYGVDVSAAMCGKGYDVAQRQLARNLPPRHLEFLQQTLLFYSYGDYFFCHAGVRPGVPLAEQSERDLLWIRQAFTDYRGSFEKVVVHGHTAVETPKVLPNRIAIDTGAYATGLLTCLVLQEQDRRFLST